MLSFFPQVVLDEILNLIESVSEGFPTYSYHLDVFAAHFLYGNYKQPQLLCCQPAEISSLMVPMATQTFFAILKNCNNFCDFLFASLNNATLPKGVNYKKKGVLSFKSYTL